MEFVMPDGFTMIPIDQPFNYSRKDMEERKGKEYWDHKYAPEWSWSENLPERDETHKQVIDL
jgi:hypothetical protein